MAVGCDIDYLDGPPLRLMQSVPAYIKDFGCSDFNSITIPRRRLLQLPHSSLSDCTPSADTSFDPASTAIRHQQCRTCVILCTQLF